jgi:hypothetical protein
MAFGSSNHFIPPFVINKNLFNPENKSPNADLINNGKYKNDFKIRLEFVSIVEQIE